MKRIAIVLLTLLSLACYSPQEIKKKETLTTLFNQKIDGIQENKLRQASELFYSGSYSKSYEIYRDLLENFLAIDNQEAVINTYFLLINNLIAMEKYDEAMKLFNMIISRITVIFDSSKEKNYYTTLYMIEVGNWMLENPNSPFFDDFVEGFLNHTLFLSIKNQSIFLLMRAYRNMGYYYFLKKNYQEANNFLSKAFDIANKSRNIMFLAQCASLIAKNFMEQEDFSSAVDYFIIAYRLYQMENRYYQQALILVDLGLLFEKMKDDRGAFRYYQRAFEIIQKSETIEETIKIKRLSFLSQKITRILNDNPTLKQLKIF